MRKNDETLIYVIRLFIVKTNTMNNTDFEFELAMLQVYVFLGYLYYVVGKNGSKMAKMAKNTPK